MSTEPTAIENLLYAYRDALNASDTSNVLTLYTTDGLFMPTQAPSARGSEQLKSAYDFVFSNIQLDIAFHIDEIVITGNHVYAVTHSQGSTLIHATGETVAEENRELFVLAQENGAWKIARYMFNKTK